MVGYFLAMDSSGNGQDWRASGPGSRPSACLPFGSPATGGNRRKYAGYTVVDTPLVLATHLTETLRRYTPELLGPAGNQDAHGRIRERLPAVVEELLPDLLSLGEIQKVLQGLLAEGIPIRNMVTILEALADAARIQRTPSSCSPIPAGPQPPDLRLYTQGDTLWAITLSGALGDRTPRGAGHLRGYGALGLACGPGTALYRELASQVERAASRGQQAVLLVSGPAAALAVAG